MLRLHRYPGASLDTQKAVEEKIKTFNNVDVDRVEIELCFYVACKTKCGNYCIYFFSC